MGAGERSIWIFQWNPEYWPSRDELARLDAGEISILEYMDSWYCPKYGGEMRLGDIALLWRTKGYPPVEKLWGIVAAGHVCGDLFEGSGEGHFPGPFVPLALTVDMRSAPVLRADLLLEPAFAQASIIRLPLGTVFRVSAEQWDTVKE
ncbi:MAG: hypothetical protein IT198_13370, partial [Acidimicrobiia bacterium]|nr:hypothetical protein [Acidimicrobiia bacterium]